MDRRNNSRSRDDEATRRRIERRERRRMERRQARVRIIGLAAILLVALVIAETSSSGASAGSGDGAKSAGSGPRAHAVDAAAFASGACVSLPPTKGERHLTVFLDAGHGGRDPGSVGVTRDGVKIHEANLTLAVELDTARLLRALGYTVVVSRTANTSVAKLQPVDIAGNELSAQGVHDDVAARAACADDAHANVLIGVYFDAGAPGNAGSVTGYDAVRPFAARNLRLAHLVQSDVLHAMNARGWNIPSEGVQKDNQLGSAISGRARSYGHLMLLGPASPGWFETPSQMPGALIEPLFITDPFEASIAAGTTGQQVIAAGLAKAVEQYFSPPGVAHEVKSGSATTRG